MLRGWENNYLWRICNSFSQPAKYQSIYWIQGEWELWGECQSFEKQNMDDFWSQISTLMCEENSYGLWVVLHALCILGPLKPFHHFVFFIGSVGNSYFPTQTVQTQTSSPSLDWSLVLEAIGGSDLLTANPLTRVHDLKSWDKRVRLV